MQYMKLLEKNLSWGNKICEGVSDADIFALEQKIGKKFPLSYKEFLTLAGEYFPYTGDVMSFSDLEYIQEKIKEELIKFGFSIEREYWAFEVFDGSQFFIFYWDEGEDPPVYLCMPCYVQNGAVLLEKNTTSFSEFINRSINYYKK